MKTININPGESICITSGDKILLVESILLDSDEIDIEITKTEVSELIKLKKQLHYKSNVLH